jgi:hypothetical protein
MAGGQGVEGVGAGLIVVNWALGRQGMVCN